MTDGASAPVLVSGGAGFIGRGLVGRLLREGRAVTVLDALVPSVHGPGAEPPEEIRDARFVQGDVRDPGAWEDALADDPEVVYHLAAETGTGESMYRAHRYVDVNAGGTARLCDAVAAGVARPRRVVLASSRAVYGEGPYRCPSDGVVHPGPRAREALEAGEWEPRCPECGGTVEPLPAGPGAALAPASVYALTKVDQEALLERLLPARDVEVLSLRLQNVYGPGQSLRNPYTGILSIFSVRLLDGEEVAVFEDGAESRDFVHVDDAVAAFGRAAEASLPDRSAVVDVGSGRSTAVLEVAHALARLYGADPGLVRVTGDYRVGDIRHARADTTAQERLLGLRGVRPLQEGLGSLAEWVRGAERPDSSLDGALDEMRRAGLLGRAADPAPAGGAGKGR